jgi:hypothetical protein
LEPQLFLFDLTTRKRPSSKANASVKAGHISSSEGRALRRAVHARPQATKSAPRACVSNCLHASIRLGHHQGRRHLAKDHRPLDAALAARSHLAHGDEALCWSTRMRLHCAGSRTPGISEPSTPTTWRRPKSAKALRPGSVGANRYPFQSGSTWKCGGISSKDMCRLVDIRDVEFVGNGVPHVIWHVLAFGQRDRLVSYLTVRDLL